MRLEILDRIHKAHQGITECRERAKTSVWWPGLSKQLEELAARCPNCVKERVNPAESVIPSELPDRPWQKVSADVFELKGHPYLLVREEHRSLHDINGLSCLSFPWKAAVLQQNCRWIERFEQGSQFYQAIWNRHGSTLRSSEKKMRLWRVDRRGTSISETRENTFLNLTLEIVQKKSKVKW